MPRGRKIREYTERERLDMVRRRERQESYRQIADFYETSPSTVFVLMKPDRAPLE